MRIEIFDKLATLFEENGYRLYMIGGTSRDFLLNRDVLDYDFVTDAKPVEMKKFLPEANYRFEMFGTVRLKIDGKHIDITTLRKEGRYQDSRHPSKIEFTLKLEEDYVRRDFTINAIYIDKNYEIIDFCGGFQDLKDKIIRFIGDPIKRVEEDPLRILRGERFAYKLGFKIEEKTKYAFDSKRDLLEKLNPEKIKEENAKYLK